MTRMIASIGTALAIAALTLVSGPLAQGNVVDGEVQKVDAPAGKITLKHGPIKNLDMDGMTMVFRVKDTGMLKGLKAGDKVKFEADRVDGQITIIKLEKAKR